MILIASVLLRLASVSPAPADAVTLTRTFQLGEKLSYSVKGTIQIEQREEGLNTFIPSDLTLSYDFTAETVQLKADGIADVIYTRPRIVQQEGETFDGPGATSVEKLNQRVRLTLSPINEILKFQDEPLPKKKKTASQSLNRAAMGPAPWKAALQSDPFLPFISEVQRLAIFIGPPDSSLDFNPKFNLDEVKVGDTWKRTVGFSPQKIKGKKDQAVQRLDYTYVYKGEVTSNGRKVRRVEATLNLETDLAEFYHQLTDSKSSDTGLGKFPLKFSGVVQFDVDPKNGRTLFAQATSTGGFSLYTIDDAEDAKVEQKFKGKTVMRLNSATVVPKKK